MLTVSFSLMIGTAPNSKQRENRVADVEIARAVIEIVGGQQHLGGVAAVGAQRAIVGFDQRGLPDRGDGLQAATRSVGRFFKPRRPMPAPTAPELTRHTLRPACINCATPRPAPSDAVLIQQPIRPW